MDLQLSAKTTLVTGSSTGIGRAIATALAREGVKVAIAARRVELLTELAQEVAAAGYVRPVVIETDLSDHRLPEVLVESARQGLGCIDILVNGAGGSRPIAVDAPPER